MENNIPVRETEIGRENVKLHSVIEKLESVRDRFSARLEGVVRNDVPKNTEEVKNPDCSTKLGQELKSHRERLEKIMSDLMGLLDRLEL